MSAVDSFERYHTFWPRVAAAIVDGLVLLPLGFLTDPQIYPYKSTGFTLFLSGTAYTAPIIYTVVLHAKYGKTVGKMALHVTVMDLSESRLPTIRQAALRDIGEILFNVAMFAQLASVVAAGGYSVGDEYAAESFWNVMAFAGVAWGILEIVSMLTNAKRRAIHDFIAGTVVVRDT